MRSFIQSNSNRQVLGISRTGVIVALKRAFGELWAAFYSYRANSWTALQGYSSWECPPVAGLMPVRVERLSHSVGITGSRMACDRLLGKHRLRHCDKPSHTASLSRGR